MKLKGVTSRAETRCASKAEQSTEHSETRAREEREELSTKENNMQMTEASEQVRNTYFILVHI